MGCLRPALSCSTSTTATATSISNFEDGFFGHAFRATASKCSPRVASTSSSKSLCCRAQVQSVETPTQQQETETVPLGQSEVRVPKIGIGSWSWGDNIFWHEGGWDDNKAREANGAFDACLDVGLPFFDTAEVYGQKLPWGGDDSESLLGRFIKEKQGYKGKVFVATKFAPYPWRLGRGSVVSTLKSSLERLGLASIDLYQLHWPGLWGNEGYLDGLGDAVEQGLVKAVGVSNYKESRLRDAYAQLKKRGITLASNQVHYSLAYRLPEKNGVKQTCDELGISLIAYSPLGQGVLTGKYSEDNIPKASRGRTYNRDFMIKLSPLLRRMKEIGSKYGKSQTQVALNWLLCQGNVIPIPGAKTASQAKEFAGALGWNLSASDLEELISISNKIKPVIGFPAEWI